MRSEDDARLWAWSSEPAQPLFRSLQYAHTMTPLLALMMVLPGLWAVLHAPLTARGAAWGLRALQLHDAPQEMGFLSSPAAALACDPPLMTWGTALVLHWTGDSPDFGLVGVALIAVGLLVAQTYLLAADMGGARLALLSALLLCCTPQVLRLGQEPLPHALSLWLGALALWAVHKHQPQVPGGASVWLLTGGFALGTCLLAGGPLAIVVLGLCAWDLWSRTGSQGPNAALQSGSWRRRLSRFSPWLSIALLAATAFAVGGWWELMQSARGGGFWVEWLKSFPVRGFTGPARLTTGSEISFLRHLAQLQPSLLPLAAVGLWQGISSLRTEFAGAPSQRLLLGWTALALVLWIASLLQGLDSFVSSLWEVFLLLPLTIFAASGFLAIADRRTSFTLTACVALASLILVGASLQGEWPSAALRSVWLLGIAVLLGGTSVIGWRSWRDLPIRDLEYRSTTGLVLLCMLLGHCVFGLAVVCRATDADRNLWVLSRAMKTETGVGRVLLVAPSDAPPQIEFLVRRVWTQARIDRLPHWDRATPELTRQHNSDAAAKTVVISWDRLDRNGVGATPPLVTLAPLAVPRIYCGGELAAHVVMIQSP